MQGIPHWQLLILIYLLLVAIPVSVVHSLLRKKALRNKTAINLIMYFAAVVGTAFFMHFLAMFLYFKFLFTHNP